MIKTGYTIGCMIGLCASLSGCGASFGTMARLTPRESAMAPYQITMDEANEIGVIARGESCVMCTRRWFVVPLALDLPLTAVSDTVLLPLDIVQAAKARVEAERKVAAEDGRKAAAAKEQQSQSLTMGIPVEKMLSKSGIVLRLIPAGTFIMGSPDTEKERMEDETQHKVTVTKAFYMGKYEVTQEQWKMVMGRNPSCFTNVGDNAPVEMVSWHDCTNFMSKLFALEGMPEGSFRLPTEAEWEYACRAGTTTAFCYGNDLDASMANFMGIYPYGSGREGEYRGKTAPVGQFKPNAWGLYDMHGNIEEWCADKYGEYEGDTRDPGGPDMESRRVLRGGSWQVCAYILRSAERANSAPGSSGHSIGFRLCMPVGQ